MTNATSCSRSATQLSRRHDRRGQGLAADAPRTAELSSHDRMIVNRSLFYVFAAVLLFAALVRHHRRATRCTAALFLVLDVLQQRRDLAAARGRVPRDHAGAWSTSAR
ncbi:MAG: hypothetical protein MZV65_33930 [Chromatiales bacterium]|nr:hypothetical protein [Chromatiales bacterium]